LGLRGLRCQGVPEQLQVFQPSEELVPTGIRWGHNLKALSRTLGEGFFFGKLYFEGVKTGCRTQDLIFGGFYAQAHNSLKQEIEMVSRIQEIRRGTAKDGKTPNVKNTPSKLGPVYGSINGVAHVSNHSALQELLAANVGTEVTAVSPNPVFIPKLAGMLWSLHLLCVVDVVEIVSEEVPFKERDSAMFKNASELVALAISDLKKMFPQWIESQHL
jgi:hypothetical protein